MIYEYNSDICLDVRGLNRTLCGEIGIDRYTLAPSSVRLMIINACHNP